MPFHNVTANRLDLACNAALDRLRENVQGAIIQAAAGMPVEGIDEPATTEHVITTWNREADAIAKRLPFPIRATRTGAISFALAPNTPQAWFSAIDTLIYLAVQQRLKAKSMREDVPGDKAGILAATRQATLYEEMTDLLLLMLAPESGIERQSSGRNSRWEVLRRTKRGKEVAWDTFQRQAKAILEENQGKEAKRGFYHEQLAKYAAIKLQIAASGPEYRDLTLGRHIHGEFQSSFDRLIGHQGRRIRSAPAYGGDSPEKESFKPK